MRVLWDNKPGFPGPEEVAIPLEDTVYNDDSV